MNATRREQSAMEAGWKPTHRITLLGPQQASQTGLVSLNGKGEGMTADDFLTKRAPSWGFDGQSWSFRGVAYPPAQHSLTAGSCVEEFRGFFDREERPNRLDRPHDDEPTNLFGEQPE